VLRVGVDRATRCGADVLLAQGREELAAAGARPRRERIGGVESLTAAERRVVDLAVEGATNREIAQALFLTQKTVETHLSSTYRKLDISKRSQLREVLGAAV
jgi:DNA-binding CsgD family transcriptional regulator